VNILAAAFVNANGIQFMEANVIKYITRHAHKNGAEDVRKAIHYCQLLLELRYGEKSKGDAP
jgi:Cdc6-like AAA superfamily ATPase